MKVLLSSVNLMALLFTMMGCAGQKTSTTLEVSRAFATTNPHYGGGLIISGTNLSTGQFFSQGLLTNTAVRFYLDAGKWVFTAVGWDGGTGATEEVFGGKPFCGTVTQDLSGTSAKVNLSLDEATCKTTAFAGDLPSTAMGKNLRQVAAITTCKSFFETTPLSAGSEVISAKLVHENTALNYCDVNLPSDLKSNVKSIRIHSYSKGPNQAIADIGIMSKCIVNEASSPSVVMPHSATPTPDNPYGAGTDLRLPLKGVPFIITLFGKGDCTQPIAKYNFKRGLQSKYASFDHLVLSNDLGSATDQVKIILPATDVKKAVSPFAHLLPSFKKGTTYFPTEPTSVTTSTYHSYAAASQTIEVDEATCPFAATLATSTNVSSTPTCVDLGDKIAITFTPSSAGAGMIKTGNTYNFHADTVGSEDRYTSNKLIWNLLGAPNSTIDFRNFFSSRYDSDVESTFGVLSRIRDLLTNAGSLAGVSDSSLTLKQHCELMEVDKQVAIFNEERAVEEAYRVKISNNVVSSPNPFICENANFDGVCGPANIPFDKRLLIWDYKSDLVNPAYVLEFSCRNLSGSYESRIVRIDSGRTFENKAKINWNTNNDDANTEKQRFEFMEHLKVKDSSNNLSVEKRSMSRMEKNGSTDYKNWNYLYNAVRDGAAWDESIEAVEQQGVSSGATIAVYYSSAAGNDVAKDYVFSTLDPGVRNLREQVTGSISPSFEYGISGTFPQPISSTWSSAIGSPVNTNGGGKINGVLNLKAEELGTPFLNQFGESFYTAP